MWVLITSSPSMHPTGPRAAIVHIAQQSNEVETPAAWCRVTCLANRQPAVYFLPVVAGGQAWRMVALRGSRRGAGQPTRVPLRMSAVTLLLQPTQRGLTVFWPKVRMESDW